MPTISGAIIQAAAFQATSGPSAFQALTATTLTVNNTALFTKAESTGSILTVGSGAFPAALAGGNNGSYDVAISNGAQAWRFAIAGENGAGGSPRFIGALSGGTIAAPSSTPNSRVLASFEGCGWANGAWQPSAAATMTFLTAEAWGAAARGTLIRFIATALGTTSGLVVAELDKPTTATQTALKIFDVDNNAVERVTVGAADSGGAGFKVLRIPN